MRGAIASGRDGSCFVRLVVVSLPSWGLGIVGVCPRSRFYGHLPKTQIDLNRSMSALPCYRQLSRGSVNVSRLIRTVPGTKITNRTYVPETNTAFHLLMMRF